ncbi:hypothetical protein IWZ01DRAFT_370305 [Phyllosticta capitalensis]
MFRMLTTDRMGFDKACFCVCQSLDCNFPKDAWKQDKRRGKRSFSGVWTDDRSSRTLRAQSVSTAQTTPSTMSSDSANKPTWDFPKGANRESRMDMPASRTRWQSSNHAINSVVSSSKKSYSDGTFALARFPGRAVGGSALSYLAEAYSLSQHSATDLMSSVVGASELDSGGLTQNITGSCAESIPQIPQWYKPSLRLTKESCGRCTDPGNTTTSWLADKAVRGRAEQLRCLVPNSRNIRQILSS